MDEYLDDFVSSDDLKKFEEIYNRHLSNGTVTPKEQFEYAWCLIRSKYAADIRRGLTLLEDLFIRGDERTKRDYLYYLAVGNTKLKEYETALKLISKFLSVEPQNRQAFELQTHIKERLKRDGMIGMAVAGGTAALIVGGLVGIGMALSRK